MTRKTVQLSPKTCDMVKECEVIYRKYHPELDEIRISLNKMVYEIARYYRDTDTGDGK